MLKGAGPRIWRPLCAGAAACAILAVLAAPSSALQVMCSSNPDGSQTCRGTDTFSYAGQYNAGCPPSGIIETVTIDEEIPQDATNVTGTWGVDPTTICGGITDASGVAYKPGDTLRGGGWTVNDQGKRVWRWTVKVNGKNPGGDHPQVIVNVSYDSPPTTTGGGGGGTDGNTGGGSTGSNGSGVCDRSVSFDNPPKAATGFPVGYHLTVHNDGTGPCPSTVLKLTHGRGVETEFAQLVAGAPGAYGYPFALFIPGLARGGSVSADVLARPNIDALGKTGNAIRVRASLPPDADSPDGSDEFATVRTKLKPKTIDLAGGQTDGHGHGMLTVGCPAGKHKHDHCTFKLDMPATPLPQDRLLFLPLGSAEGTVAAGQDGDLALRLREAGRRILEHRHQERVTLVGTRTEDGVSTLVKGHATLKQ